MDAVLDPSVRVIVWAKSTQVGYTDAVLNNIIGYYIDVDPRPIMIVLPVVDDAKGFSKKKITPMIEATAALRDKVRVATARRAGNTLQLKEFPGGFLKLTGANSGKGLRSDPIAVLLLDEVDAYPDDVAGEGDPLEIAMRRTDTYDDAKIIMGSTPAKPAGISRIEQEYKRSDQRRYFVPCPHCGHFQPLQWRNPNTTGYCLDFERTTSGDVVPGSVRYVCVNCQIGIDEKHKRAMLGAGRWNATAEGRPGVRGYHINALYSPWRMVWEELAQEWINAQDNPERLKTFVNLRLGETWDEGGESFGAHVLEERRENYPAEVPEGVVVLVAAADIQANRIEAQIKGFGAGEEEWLIAHEVFWGNPDTRVDPDTAVDVWAELDRFLLRQWKHARGFDLTPAVTLVDSGHAADSVYDFVEPRQGSGRRVFACKGVQYLSKPGLVRKAGAKRETIRLWEIATTTAKDRIFARMRIPPDPEGKAKAGLMHFPEWTTSEYFEQLTGEKKITVRDKRTRTKKYVYVKTYQNNEALDLTVYCHAALSVLSRFVDPVTYRDLDRLSELLRSGQTPEAFAPVRRRRIRSRGI